MKTKKLKMNVWLLRRIQREMLKEPARVNMSIWASLAADMYMDITPPCGTVGCIAGLGLMLTKAKKKDFQTIAKQIKPRSNNAVQREAGNLFGITPPQRRALFHVTHWPLNFRQALRQASEGTAACARVVCQRIDHFIKTGN